MEEVKKAKCYAVTFDCTPDVSHLEQMSQVSRYVRGVGNVPNITERFIDFLPASTNRRGGFIKVFTTGTKKEGDTRWSTRREAVTVVYKHLDKIVEALNQMLLDAVSSPETKSGVVSLLKSIHTFEFVAFTCFWQKTFKKNRHRH
ncbi:hypothetical protein AVEN_154741-1 [Araneus ventricosus]|uniref:Uncharacterized protein n=1 Tax=Araneus ventricosus TaxID=182803 RepID=A0A4Y2TLF9_ARAVE|nr:hypothetical protein AVEN_154741-1 [Araneus ventricosus]